MDTLNPSRRLLDMIRKYKHAILILLVGIILMFLPANGAPEEKKQAEASIPVQTMDLEAKLRLILQKIHGAGEVDVLLTIRTGEQTLFQTEEEQQSDTTNSRKSSRIVIVENAQNQESGLIYRTDPPEYMGAVIVCQGADNPSVKLAIVEAVKCVTGLGADQITVVKMQ